MLGGIHPYWNFISLWFTITNETTIITEMQFTMNFILCSYQADPTTFPVPRVIHASATRYPRETISKNSQNFLTMARISIIWMGWISDFNACAKVCLKFRKFSKLPNFERDKYVSVNSSFKGRELFCVANGSSELSFWSSAPVVSLASGMLIMLTYCVLKYATTADTQCMENVGS